MVVSVDARIGEPKLLSEPERRKVLVEWNQTEAGDSWEKCVHELFEEQARGRRRRWRWFMRKRG